MAVKGGVMERTETRRPGRWGWALIGAGVLAGRALLRRGERLTGRVVLVTGGSRGLGLAMARVLGDHGARLVICARDPVELEEARADLEGRGAEVLAVTADVTVAADIERLVARTRERFGGLDVLINNAGIIQVGPLEHLSRQDFERAMAVMFWGPLDLVRAFLPDLRAHGRGRIVNVTSIGGVVAVPHLLPYSCGKFAEVGLSEGLAAELDREGIAVTTIVPGLMRTGSPIQAEVKGRQEEELTWFALGDSLPITSMSAERAARRIVLALRRRERFVTLSWQAKALRLVHALAPATTIRGLAWVNRALPSPRGGSSEAVKGMQLTSSLVPSRWTVLMNRAARRLNELGGSLRPSPEHARRIQ